jgi:tetratricopeptide (TPR) repeat protein/predicted Ser/Thr protein kinase
VKKDEELAFGETAIGSNSGTPPPAPVSTDLAAGAAIGARYVVTSVLGKGGMGTVYLARDTTLGRDVAVKLHRHGSSHDRLYREALAMAQIEHPNVVTVFEVGAADDQLFVAMEYVKGGTLRDWAGKQHAWRDVIEMLVEVGEGLAAAHKAGLVHRDFKPENVLVGDDGRPRVSDFGLARGNPTMESMPSLTPSSRPPSTPLPVQPIPISGPMTVTGAMLGTPAYMPPEQYAGAEADARSDQFSFCVAAWESLYQQRPFVATTLPALQQAIERGKLDIPKESPVPARVRRVLARGLQPRSEDRWPDLPTLLAALRDAARPRKRRTVALAAAGVGAAALVGFGVWKLVAPSARSCATAGAELDALVPAQLLTDTIELARHVRGDDLAHRTEQHLAAFTTKFHEAARGACEARQRHDWSDELEQKAAACRDGEARNAAAVLHALIDTGFRERVGPVTAQLADLADLSACRDPAALAATAVTSPENREIRAQLFAIRELAAAHFVDDAQARLAHVPSADPALAASLALVRSSLARARNDFDTAMKEATDAYYRAHADVDETTEQVALAAILQIAHARDDLKGLDSWYRLALAEVGRFDKRSPIRAAELRAALVGAAERRDELPVAVEQAKLAVAGLANGTSYGQATAIREYANALATSGDLTAALPLYAQAEKLFTETLGPGDSELAAVLSDEALTLSEAGKYEDAQKVAERARDIVTHLPTKSSEVANIELNIAAVMVENQDDDHAEPLLRDARALVEKAFGPKHTMLATIDTNMALIAGDHDHPDEAARLLREAIAIEEASLGPDHIDVAATLFNLSAALSKSGDHDGAFEASNRCVAIRAKQLPNSDLYAAALAQRASVENDLHKSEDALRDAIASLAVPSPHAGFQARSWPQLEQAKALVALGRTPQVARALLTEARAAYAENKINVRVTEIDALLGRLK